MNASPFVLAVPLQHTPMSKNKEVSGGRSWWRKLFDEHPKAADKAPDAYVESETGQTKSCKVYCNACLIIDIRQIEEEDLHALDQGRVNIVQTECEIKAYCKLINWFLSTLTFIVILWSVEQITVKQRNRRIHSLCCLDLSQSPQVLSKPPS